MKTVEEINQFLDNNSIDTITNKWKLQILIEWEAKNSGEYILLFGDKSQVEENEASFISTEDLLHSIENYEQKGLPKPIKISIVIITTDEKITVYEGS